MEASHSEIQINIPNPNIDANRNLIGLGQSDRNSLSPSSPVWPTIDGPLGLSEEESVNYARKFYKFGFALLPLLWAVNCFYFWPVLRHSRSFPRIRRYLTDLSYTDIVKSAVGLSVCTILLSSWALTFAIGGERLFGPVWDQLVMYNLADEWGLTGWS